MIGIICREAMLKRLRQLFLEGYGLIFLISLLTRFYRIQRHPLWFDELYSYQVSSQPIFKIIQNSFYESHPPLYYLLLKLTSSVHHSEVGVRWFSALCAAFSLLAIYYISSQISDRWCSLGVWFLLITSPEILYFSQEARSYIVAMTVTTVSTTIVFYLSFGRKRQYDLNWTLVLWAVSSITGLYITYAYFMIFGIQSLYLISLYRFKPKFIVSSTGVLVAILPLVPLLLSNLSSDLNRTGGSGSLTLLLLAQALLAGDPNRYGYFWGSSILPLVLGCFAIVGCVGIIKSKKLFGQYLIAQVVMPICFFFWIGYYHFDLHLPAFQSKQFLVLLPSFFLLMAYGLDYLICKTSTLLGYITLAIIYSILIVASFVGMTTYWTITKSPEGLAVQYVQRYRSVHEPLVSLHYSVDSAASFYLQGDNSVYAKPQKVGDEFRFDRELLVLRRQVSPRALVSTQIIRSNPSFWVIYDSRRKPAVLVPLIDNCDIMSSTMFGPFNVSQVRECKISS